MSKSKFSPKRVMNRLGYRLGVAHEALSEAQGFAESDGLDAGAAKDLKRARELVESVQEVLRKAQREAGKKAEAEKSKAEEAGVEE